MIYNVSLNQRNICSVLNSTYFNHKPWFNNSSVSVYMFSEYHFCIYEYVFNVNMEVVCDIHTHIFKNKFLQMEYYNLWNSKHIPLPVCGSRGTPCFGDKHTLSCRTRGGRLFITLLLLLIENWNNSSYIPAVKIKSHL